VVETVRAVGERSIEVENHENGQNSQISVPTIIKPISTAMQLQPPSTI
jgi:hypothetical protein